MTGAYHIVPMEACHVEEVSALEHLCFTAPWSKETLAKEFQGRGCRYVVAREAETGRVLGCAGLRTVLDEGSIDDVAVLPECRRRGIALAMMEAFCQVAQEEKLAFLTLEVRASNLAAIGLYETLGFGPVGRRRGYYQKPKEDAILMTRRFAYDPLDLEKTQLP